MMRQMACGGGMPGHARACPGMGRGGKKAKGKAQAQRGKKAQGRSGNPAKRAQEAQAIAARESGDRPPAATCPRTSSCPTS